MQAEAVRAFLERGWAELQRLRREHWARQRREQGPLANLRASEALFEHVRRVRPDWPGERERAADLARHIEARRLFDRVAGAFSAD